MTDEEICDALHLLEPILKDFSRQLQVLTERADLTLEALETIRSLIDTQGQRIDNLEQWCRSLDTQIHNLQR